MGARLNLTLLVLTPASTEVDEEARVTVSLYHCGFNPLEYDGRTWEVPVDDEPFDQTNAPDGFTGEGTITRIDDDELRYRDDSGVVVRFIPGDGKPNQMCA